MKQQPIRDKDKIEIAKKYLKSLENERNYFLFVLGINVGKRMGDLLKLKVKDIKDRERLVIVDEKTKKVAPVYLNKTIQSEIKKYCRGKNDNDYLFPSRQLRHGMKTHICYKRAYDILKDVFSTCKIEDAATHTLRKTFGYWVYKTTGKTAELQKIFKHSSEKVTHIYIGVEQDEQDKTIKEFGGL